MIERAADENDEVLLFVSTSDRARPGELPIFGADKLTIWNRYLTKHLPSNVRATLGGIPVRQTYEALDMLSTKKNVTKIRIYAGKEDLEVRFTDKSLMKYAGELYRAGKIELVVTPRMTSGTRMRQLISAGDRTEFERLLPPIPAKDKRAIWNLLHAHVGKTQAETFIRMLVNDALVAG